MRYKRYAFGLFALACNLASSSVGFAQQDQLNATITYVPTIPWLVGSIYWLSAFSSAVSVITAYLAFSAYRGVRAYRREAKNRRLSRESIRILTDLHRSLSEYRDAPRDSNIPSGNTPKKIAHHVGELKRRNSSLSDKAVVNDVNTLLNLSLISQDNIEQIITCMAAVIEEVQDGQ